MSRKPFATLAVAGAALAGCGSAWAHGAFGTTSLWTAPYHLFTSPLSLAALIGLALVLFGIREPASLMAAGLAAVAATLMASGWLSPVPAVAAPAAVAVLGLGAVAGFKPSTGWALVLAVLAGLAAGHAAELEQPRWQDLAGLAITVLVATFWLLASAENLNQSERLQPVLPIARRVLGSWVTALALLLAALAVLAVKA